ncbi:polyhydroxyalkanoate synthesis repressor PhaR [Oricola thermophila]|uniref:Polyhydroxyalkanoate synthesis repressor PhaR n=1 Tax=Oricola thermophila TaxID=2742145 RepID=A0A6N1VH10_9HYPH|nr:polyhydroxyalkanoate synthesis repressor PhaR [Oricola thermophila]QKV20104.1 polyhydroxyalkanoate synthesis repressor PhaR [Oricola thermophila]
MAASDEPTVIKKYANRRLYNTGTSTYVTLEDLATMVKDGEEFVVQDAKSGEDLTHAVLTQIIFEQEGKTGQAMLPISVLRQLISFYGDQMQMVLPSYLEHSMTLFTREQERIREQMTSMVGKSPLDIMASGQKLIEEQTRRNMEMFQNAMQMFSPFNAAQEEGAKTGTAESEKKAAPSDELKAMREQIAAMQRKLDSLEK